MYNEDKDFKIERIKVYVRDRIHNIRHSFNPYLDNCYNERYDAQVDTLEDLLGWIERLEKDKN